MLAKTRSVALVGTEARLVDVELDVNTGVPKFTVVGLPSASVREAEQRTRSALLSSEERWPPARITANLAPGSLRKQGAHFDLAIAAATVAADGRLECEALEGWVFFGELALDGAVRPGRGVLPAAIAAKESGLRGIICPAANAAEAAVIDGIEVVPVHRLSEALGFLRARWVPGPIETQDAPAVFVTEDVREVRGQGPAKRALEIAAAGGHNVLMRVSRYASRDHDDAGDGPSRELVFAFGVVVGIQAFPALLGFLGQSHGFHREIGQNVSEISPLLAVDLLMGLREQVIEFGKRIQFSHR